MKPTREQCLEWARILPDCRDEQLVEFMVAEITALIYRAYAEGQKDMRERAARSCETRRNGANELMDTTREMEAYAIRNLEIEE